MADVEKKVYELLINELKVDKVQVARDTILKSLSIDSLDVFVLLTLIEDSFGISIGVEELVLLDTINDLISFIEKKLLNK